MYELWRDRGLSGLRVAHVDFHCDMRGLLIDRRRQRARFLAEGRPPAADSGNYLAVAAMEGTVEAVTWVHDAHGGRRYDAGTVKYESDLTSLLGRLRGAGRTSGWHPLWFRELGFDAWAGPEPGEDLDIDWDGLASIEYTREHSRRLVESFLARDWPVVPERMFVVESPGYSDPDPAFLEEFVERLAERFGAEVVRLPAPALPPGYPLPPQRLPLAGRLKHRLVIALHGLGIH